MCVDICSHSGLLVEAEMHFADRGANYGIAPIIEHHTCMVMVLEFAGHFNKVMHLMMSMQPDRGQGCNDVWVCTT